MTARGFGKRGEGEDRDFSDSYGSGRKCRAVQTSIVMQCTPEPFSLALSTAGSFPSNPQNNDVYRDAALANQLRQKALFAQLNNYLSDYPERDVSNPIPPPLKNHRLQLRDGTLKFRLNDGNLRIGRGFGKRSFGADPFAEK
jgi:hypothetical protein